MNKGKRLKSTFELVRDIFLQHPDWNARQIYDRYRILIGDAKNAVTLNAVQKQIQKLKKTYQGIKAKGIDTPWSLSKTPNLHAEAIAAILRVQKWAEGERIEHVSMGYSTINFADRHGITIRQALWIARLHAIKGMDKNPILLWRASYVYAIHELIGELSDTPNPDTWQLDRALRKSEEEFRLLGMNILDNHESFEAHFKLHMASERVRLLKVKSVTELAEQARERLKQLQSKQREIEK